METAVDEPLDEPDETSKGDDDDVVHLSQKTSAWARHQKRQFADDFDDDDEIYESYESYDDENDDEDFVADIVEPLTSFTATRRPMTTRRWTRLADNNSRKLLDIGSSSEADDRDRDEFDGVEFIDDEEMLPRSGGRRRRRIKRADELQPSTRQAMEAEVERRHRLQEQNPSVTAPSGAVSVFLEFADDENRTPLLKVHPTIASHLKGHQIEAVQFMWQACCESLEQLKNPNQIGGGCIIAHCMGLGKTLSSISFVHTLLRNSDATGIRTCLIMAPLNAQLNWIDEFKRWVPKDSPIDVYEISSAKSKASRVARIKSWQQNGGVLVIGYNLYRTLVQGRAQKLKTRRTEDKRNKTVTVDKESSFYPGLVVPGPDVVICDEGHVLKSDTSALSQIVRHIRTRRRIILTGTPLQNNLMEYHCMVSFVKPDLLGDRKEFANGFANPIKNGECKDSTNLDVRIMKRRISVLYRLLSGFVHRRGVDYLKDALPTKFEYVVMLRLTEPQAAIYRNYLTDVVGLDPDVEISSDVVQTLRKRLFADYYALRYVYSHPYMLYVARRNAEEQEKKECRKNGVFDDDEEDEFDLGLDVTTTKTAKTQRAMTTKMMLSNEGKWFTSVVGKESAYDPSISSKIMVMVELIRGFEAVGDKTLVFSQSLLFLNQIESMLADEENKRKLPTSNCTLPFKKWRTGRDFYRIDGSVSAAGRSSLINKFNHPENHRARLFLISTRAGGMGVNLVAANRCIILDISWNPCNDSQALFRTYRFGQTKPVYVYRLVAAGTMEEKIYDRQIMKHSLAHRVVDEQQILRHFTSKEISKLYTFESEDNVVIPPGDVAGNTSQQQQPPVDGLPDGQLALSNSNDFGRYAVPKDSVFADLLLRCPQFVRSFHDHDSLLAHQEDQVLSEIERVLAWREYECERRGCHVDTTDPPECHRKLTAGYQTQYQMPSELAAFHSLCYMRDQFSDHSLAVRQYVDLNMQAVTEKAQPFFKTWTPTINQNSALISSSSSDDDDRFVGPTKKTVKLTLPLYDDSRMKDEASTSKRRSDNEDQTSLVLTESPLAVEKLSPSPAAKRRTLPSSSSVGKRKMSSSSKQLRDHPPGQSAFSESAAPMTTTSSLEGHQRMSNKVVRDRAIDQARLRFQQLRHSFLTKRRSSDAEPAFTESTAAYSQVTLPTTSPYSVGQQRMSIISSSPMRGQATAEGRWRFQQLRRSFLTKMFNDNAAVVKSRVSTESTAAYRRTSSMTSPSSVGQQRTSSSSKPMWDRAPGQSVFAKSVPDNNRRTLPMTSHSFLGQQSVSLDRALGQQSARATYPVTISSSLSQQRVSSSSRKPISDRAPGQPASAAYGRTLPITSPSSVGQQRMSSGSNKPSMWDRALSTRATYPMTIPSSPSQQRVSSSSNKPIWDRAPGQPSFAAPAAAYRRTMPIPSPSSVGQQRTSSGSNKPSMWDRALGQSAFGAAKRRTLPTTSPSSLSRQRVPSQSAKSVPDNRRTLPMASHPSSVGHRRVSGSSSLMGDRAVAQSNKFGVHGL